MRLQYSFLCSVFPHILQRLNFKIIYRNPTTDTDMKVKINCAQLLLNTYCLVCLSITNGQEQRKGVFSVSMGKYCVFTSYLMYMICHPMLELYNSKIITINVHNLTRMCNISMHKCTHCIQQEKKL